MQKLLQWDRFISAHLPLFVLGVVIFGVSFPAVFVPINAVSIPLFAFLSFANSLGGGFRELSQVFLRPLPVLVSMILLHVLLPLIAMGVGTLLLPDYPLFTTGLVLEFSVPTGVSSLIWVGLCGGSAMLCLSIVLLDTLLSPLVIPLTLKLLLGSVVEMDTLGMMKDMLLMVALPAVVGMFLYQRTKGRVATTLQPKLSFFSKVVMLLIVGANASGCAPFLREINSIVILVMLLSISLCLFGFFSGFWAGKLLKMDFSTSATLCLNTGLRNLNAGAVLAMAYFPPDVLFPVALTPLFLQIFTSLVAKVMHVIPSGKAYFAEKDSHLSC